MDILSFNIACVCQIPQHITVIESQCWRCQFVNCCSRCNTNNMTFANCPLCSHTYDIVACWIQFVIFKTVFCTTIDFNSCFVVDCDFVSVDEFDTIPNNIKSVNSNIFHTVKSCICLVIKCHFSNNCHWRIFCWCVLYTYLIINCFATIVKCSISLWQFKYKLCFALRFFFNIVHTSLFKWTVYTA